MTPTQRKQLANILLKEGEDGWRVYLKHIVNPMEWFAMPSDHTINRFKYTYRAVRIERIPTRTPLPIEHYKRGMEVLVFEHSGAFLVIEIRHETGWVVAVLKNLISPSYYAPSRIIKWRWPNESEWKPAYTETIEEREVERLEVEGL
jgi:hypothetical protein